MNYDLFLSDFDGTLVHADGMISNRNIRAIARYRQAGGTFAVVTGRMLTSILPRLEGLGIEEGLVCAYQGAVIADIATKKLLKCEGFSFEEAQRVLCVLEGKGEHVHIYSVWELYSNRDDDMLHTYEEICRVKAVIADDLIEVAKSISVIKILVMVEPERRFALRRELEEALGEKYYVTCSSEWLVEIMPAGQTKAAAVDFLSAHYGVPLARVAAVGDQLNDLPMIERAGGKFAVENGEEALKTLAVVVPSCEEDGVAVAIEKYALGEGV